MGTRVSDPVHGIMLLDKPLGVSSNHALQRVRFAIGAAKAGHTGSLDPLATGMLPVCFGEATKIAGLLLGARKSYRALIVLGATTTTDDAEGEIVATTTVTPAMRSEAQAALASLAGRIRQRPPVYSALKQGGVPLYKRVRRGETVEAPEREVDIFAIQDIQLTGDRIEATIECGSGTYIRSIARDLGARIGCGAHLGGLRRTWVEPFRDAGMISMAEVLERGQACRRGLMRMEDALRHLPEARLCQLDAEHFSQGQKLVAATTPAAESVAVLGPDAHLLGLGAIDAAGVLTPTRVFNLPR